MSKRPLRAMLISIGVVVLLLLVTILAGKSPKLGLDLQGGISVNLQPVKDGEVSNDVTEDQMDSAIEIIRKRVDAVGVAEPEVSRQGNTITVQIPGATDQKEVLDLVGQTAELRFRPVLAAIGPPPTGEDLETLEAEAAQHRADLGIPEGVTAQDVVDAEIAAMDPEADPNAPIEPKNEWGVDVNDEAFGELLQEEQQLNAAQVTPDEDDKPEATVTLLDSEGNAFQLGPSMLTGKAIEDATAGLNQTGQWVVQPVFHDGADGIDSFNEIAAICNAGDPQTCPPLSPENSNAGSLAIVLDHEILTYPTISQPNYQREGIEISGDFDQESAQALAVALRYGSLPIELEPQQAETVSPTLGQDALSAGIVAGIIGLSAVFLYLFIYYRRLTIMTLLSLLTSATLLWVVMSWVGATVTLAGVVGIVVSIGIAVDSSVLIFEGIKEDVRAGSTVRSVADRSMTRSYSTILKADTSSLIGAAVLYWLSIGPVRGFAFYLGAATLLDLISAFFVLRPGVLVMGRSKLGAKPRKLGIPIDDLPETTQAKVLLTASKGA